MCWSITTNAGNGDWNERHQTRDSGRKSRDAGEIGSALSGAGTKVSTAYCGQYGQTINQWRWICLKWFCGTYVTFFLVWLCLWIIIYSSPSCRTCIVYIHLYINIWDPPYVCRQMIVTILPCLQAVKLALWDNDYSSENMTYA